MTIHLYDYAEILPQVDTLPSLRLSYAVEETGWAAVLEPGVVLLTNLPSGGSLRLYDIVTLEPPDDPDALPCAGNLLQRYFSAALWITYPPGASAAETGVHYRAVQAVIEAVGGVTEGLVPGVLVANLPAHAVATVREQLAQQLGVTVQALEVDEKGDEAEG